jgi:2-methylcitrate dehydratase PrpD
MESPTQALARFSSHLKFEDLPPNIVEAFKTYLLDGIGCGIFGSTQPWSKIVNGMIKEEKGKRESTLWLERFKGPSSSVSLGLGVMIHSFDFDDYHNAKIHPGAVVIPAALSMGERLEVSGKRTLTAMVAGYETMVRVALATGPNSSRERGWHLTGTTGTFGAAAAAGNLLGLSQDGMASSLGLAGSQSAGLWAFNVDGAMSKRFHPGRSSQSGVISALLASRGFTGPSQILEAEDGGFFKAMSEVANPSLVFEDLGEKFLSIETNIKPYACCASAHSSIDGIIGLTKVHGFRPAEVEKIYVRTARGVILQCGFQYKPLSVLQAQMSLQYCVAVSLLEGQVLIEQFSEKKISDPEILSLARRVEVILDPEIDQLYPEKFASRVEVVLKNGRRFETRVDSPLGSPERPMTFEKVAEKFKSLAGRVMSEDQTDALVERVESFDQLKSMDDLTRFLR